MAHVLQTLLKFLHVHSILGLFEEEVTEDPTVNGFVLVFDLTTCGDLSKVRGGFRGLLLMLVALIYNKTMTIFILTLCHVFMVDFFHLLISHRAIGVQWPLIKDVSELLSWLAEHDLIVAFVDDGLFG